MALGEPGSIAVLFGAKRIVLPPCRQHIVVDGDSVNYLGGEIAFDWYASEQWSEWIEGWIAEFPGKPRGWIGFDFVMTSCTERPLAIEINPRLTTSFIGYQQLIQNQLTQGIIDVCRGVSWTPHFEKIQLQFEADGTIRDNPCNNALYTTIAHEDIAKTREHIMSEKHRFQSKKFRVAEGEKIRLRKISTEAGKELADKERAAEAIAADVTFLQEAQQKLFASASHSLLIIFQGMDASGKDGVVRHVMNGVNPQGCRVYSFKAPNSEDLQHHFLWRPMRFLPERGMISIFNRSYYEEVLVVRVHPDFLKPQRIPKLKDLDELWEQRFEEIKNFERMLVQSGTSVLKFFLHVSRGEQKKRMLERLSDPTKYWKFNERDLVERSLWKNTRKLTNRCCLQRVRKNPRGTSFLPTTNGTRGPRSLTSSRITWKD